MALIRVTLKEDIKHILIGLKDELNQENAIEEYADRLSVAIDKYIRSGKVEIEAGITVQTTGSASSQTGKTTTKGVGVIK